VAFLTVSHLCSQVSCITTVPTPATVLAVSVLKRASRSIQVT
jgi:hypothetical protein